MSNCGWRGLAGCLLMGAALAAVRAEDAVAPAPAKPPGPELKGELIFLRDFGSDDTGYLAIPQQEPRAGVVVAHGITGLSRTFRHSCDQLAEQGYLVLAVDFYNGRIPSGVPEARRVWETLDQKLVTAALKTARAFYASSPRFKIEKVVLVGVGESVPAVVDFASGDHALAGVTLVLEERGAAPPAVEKLTCPGQVIVYADQTGAWAPGRVGLEVGGVNEIWTGVWPEQSVAGEVWGLASVFWERQAVGKPQALAKKLIEKIF